MLKLYIGNKNYSSWSMRPWVLMRQSGISFEEVTLRFDSFAPNSSFKLQTLALAPTGKVPLLADESLVIWDSLAICEYLAERFPDKHLWPQTVAQRAHARSLVAQMHSGFGALRSFCPMNIEAQLQETGARLWAEHADLRSDVQQLEELWTPLLTAASGPMLFGQFSIADAFFAPVCMRLNSYGLPTSTVVRDYVQRVTQLPSTQEWIQAALAEQDFLQFEEPYRQHR
ncbi:glutathione S-transferase family protein [Comamonas resistens]|uniref:Glutathione S-transferase family protein n=1 Tax=Comamonas resistens TaxID=3046670 RepID=A0ABY8SPE2_9BURK|nr:glutathione S-transferase family protein [Comamonas resistens]MDL5036613.1 glutathione S-transferase family protein [Comamonas resistens]WHS64949.1 glutathione S-transferase family protein [Comamonas resistens]